MSNRTHRMRASLGTALGSEFLINTYTAQNQIHPAVAMDADGDFVIAWASSGQDGSHGGVYAKRFNAQGQELAPPVGVGIEPPKDSKRRKAS